MQSDDKITGNDKASAQRLTKSAVSYAWDSASLAHGLVDFILTRSVSEGFCGMFVPRSRFGL
jgi:seryl-tRNA synthetase